MKIKNEKMISLGFLLCVTSFIGLGAGVYHIFNKPNNVNAEYIAETTTDSSKDETYQTIVKTEQTTDTSKQSSTKNEASTETEQTEIQIETSTEEPMEFQESQVIVQEPVEVQEEQPVEQETVETKTEPVVEQESSPAAMTINMLGRTINYQNGGTGAGQSIIDSNPNGVASTWGGSAVQSGNDGLNTHFIGHNPGIFDVVFSLTSGDTVTITDSLGQPTVYTVRTILNLDDYGTNIADGTSYWDTVIGTGGGERVTFQTCINDSTNLIVIAYK